MAETETKHEAEGPKDGVTIFVNNRPVTLPDREVTGAEIEAEAGVPPDFVLYEEKGGQLVQIAPDEQIKIHPNEKFRAVSGQDVS
jgi:hypothetical protein